MSNKQEPLIQVVPLPNNILFNTNNIQVNGIKNNNIENYNPNGNYIVTSSSIASNDTQPFNVFNGSEKSFWQCDYYNNPKYSIYKNPYPKYTQNPYNNNNDNYNINGSLKIEIPSSYQGGGNEKNKWTTTLVNDIKIPGEWIQIQTPFSFYLSKYTIMTPSYSDNISTFPLKFTVVGSNDGNTWNYLDQYNLEKKSLPNKNKPVKDFYLNSVEKYSYFRLIISELFQGMTNIKINQWNLLGSLNISMNSKSGTENFKSMDEKIFSPNFTNFSLGYAFVQNNYESFDNYMNSNSVYNEYLADLVAEPDETPNEILVSDIKEFQITPMLRISSDYTNLTNKINSKRIDLSNNIAEITNSNKTGLRDQLMANDFYDYSGNLLYYLNPPSTTTDAMIEDTNAIIAQQNSIYILGAITSATLLVFAIMLAGRE